MAHVEDRWKRDGRSGTGRRWRVRYQDTNGRERSRSFDRKTDAERFRVQVEAAAQNIGVYVDPKRGAQLVRDYGEDKFLPSLVHLRANSASTYVSHLRTHVWPLLGDRRIGSLEKTDIKAFVAAKSAELAPSTVETVLAVLRAMMSAAVEDKVVVVNPCSRVPLPQITPRVLVPLEPSQVLALTEAVPARYRVGVVLGAGAGLRFGEATGMTVPRVEHLRRRIQVLEQAQNGALAPLKTRASRRTVPVGDWVLEAVAAHLARYGPGPEQIVMSNTDRRVIRRAAFGAMWRAAVAAAGLPAGTRFHDLRHFYASALIAANLNPKVIQARLGHATMAETMDTYGHLFPDSEDLGRMAVDDALAQALTAPVRPRSAL
jgi:integrase